jgi:7-cyano-7-deazaguanine synthase in queuosine biosynthesis
MDIVCYFTLENFNRIKAELHDVEFQLILLDHPPPQHRISIRRDLLQKWIDNAVIIAPIHVDTTYNLSNGFRNFRNAIITRLIHIFCDVVKIRAVIGMCKSNFVKHIKPPRAWKEAVHRLVRNPKV